MSTKTTIDTGVEKFTIDSDVFKKANTRAQNILSEIDELTKDLKEVGDEVEEAGGMKAAKAVKYFKTRYAEKLKDVKTTSEVYEQLTEILDGASTKAGF